MNTQHEHIKSIAKEIIDIIKKYDMTFGDVGSLIQYLNAELKNVKIK